MEVRILGALEARIDGRAVDLGVRKDRLCLAVLALNVGTPVRTTQLAEALWPAGPPARWESALQSHISRLRNALEPSRAARAPSTVIETQGDAYVLHLGDDDLDARRFERAASDGRAALARGEHERAAALLRTALAEWRGPVLADISDAHSLSTEVHRLDEVRLVASEERAEAELALGRHASAVADLEVLVHEYPLRERCWELLLLALYRSGRQAEALRRFQEVRAVLVGELGIEPGPALRDLEGAILRHESGLSRATSTRRARDGGAAGSVAIPAWLRPGADAFVGRRPELGALERAFQRSANGARGLVLVEGEPGIGKTRLVREACAGFAAEGAVVLGGRCIEEPLHVLQPFAEAIGRLAAADGDRLAHHAPADVAALATLVPEFAVHAAPAMAVDADAHRYLLFRGVSSLLDADLIGRAIVLVLDDLQWAPPSTLQLLAHIVRDEERGGLLAVATVRATEPNDELTKLIADLRGERRVERIVVGGLDADDVTRLVAARSVDAHANDMFVKTQGNPFYVEELVRHLDESGGVLDDDAVPDSVRDTIARRLLRLPDEARRLLGIAAVCGAEFRNVTIARAADVGIDAVDDTMELATRSGVVEERPASVGEYGFSHALIQTVLRDGLGSARRARVHRRIGEALMETGGDDGEIARHLLAAAADGSDPVPGAEAALRAASDAVRRYTYDDAVALLEGARATLDVHELTDDRLACRVALALARALRNAGVYSEREPVLESAWTRAMRLDDAELLADVVIEGCSLLNLPTDPWPERIVLVRARLDEDSRGRLLLTALEAAVLATRPGDRARELAEWSVARSDAFGPIEKHVVMMHATLALSASNPIERVVELARAACDAARDAGTSFELVEALSVLRLTYLGAGDLERSDEIAHSYEELARAVRIPRYMAGVEQRRAMRALLAGRFAPAEAHANQAYVLQPTDEYLEGLAVQLFAICYEQGRFDEIRPAVEQWAAVYDRPAWHIGLATLLAEAGDIDAAREAILPVLDAGLTNVAPPDDLFFLCAAASATTVAEIGAVDYAPALYEMLAPHASRVIVAASGALCWGSIHRVLGPLAALVGNTERASVHFEASMAVHERLGARPFLARDRLAYARMLRGTGGDAVRVAALERTGLALARELGMRQVIARY